MRKLYNYYGAYANARDAAWQTLINHQITELPVRVVDIATNADISVIKNKDIHYLNKNQSAVSLLTEDQWTIIYDETMSRERCRFTVAHELGHIFLGHPLKDRYYARSIDTSKPMTEKQADMFAARLLSPACVIWGLDLHTPEEIKNACNISYTAAKVRAGQMEKLYEKDIFLKNKLEIKVFENFQKYICTQKKYKRKIV